MKRTPSYTAEHDSRGLLSSAWVCWGSTVPDAHCQPRWPSPLPTYLVVDSVQLVVEGHGQVGGRAGGHVCDERGFALVHGVIHVHPTLANLHVLET